MPLFPTPGQLASRADFYHQLSQLTGAGLGMLQVLEHQVRHPSDPSLAAALPRLLAHLENGATLGDAFRSAGPAFTPFEVSLVDSGERSGRLPEVFGSLAADYLSRAQMLRQTLSGLLYPAAVLHLALFVVGLLSVVQGGDPFWALLQLAGLLIPLYALGWLALRSVLGARGEASQARAERLLGRVPWLGKARHDLALARLASALEALLSAGVNVIEAWSLAAGAAGSPALRRAVLRWQPALRDGATPAELLAASPEFPEVFSNLYRTGEVSGKLDETLRRLQALHHEQGMAGLKSFVDWLPRVIFVLVALLAAYVVVRFWMGYFGAIGQVLDS
ncbi:MAG: hypothetical protein RJA22_1221 [Verrucomicrobiota bacterium]|jgi:type II secretory pathway component PulF